MGWWLNSGHLSEGLNDDDARSMSFFLTKKAALSESSVCPAAVMGSSDEGIIEMFAQQSVLVEWTHKLLPYLVYYVTISQFLISMHTS